MNCFFFHGESKGKQSKKINFPWYNEANTWFFLQLGLFITVNFTNQSEMWEMGKTNHATQNFTIFQILYRRILKGKKWSDYVALFPGKAMQWR